ncbi:YceI family protein [Azospira inquinata]|uniref:Polyisoprenoid-binding protein n=1 Tax=Azospira inquinata TaxID=2785627 RepID=A0A975SKT4_9RHOO|nr:YceI family protein [Azospira inquinata]QWT46543.1 polyisoprenoid-binding protein [Azospira inquinata]QWT48132.1 polyisoprenoid-binding protein [Azospira inquinata]
MKRFTQLALATAFAATALPALAAPDTFIIDTTHTFPRFSYSHFGYSTQLSRFDKTSGKITIDRAAKTGSVDVTIDMKSVDTGYSVFNGHIQGEDFLDTAKYPTATFKSSKVKFDGDKVVAVDGNLTIKGITKPVTLTVTSFKCMPHPMLKKEACGANASTVIKRTEFNAGKYAPYVSDEVTLDIAVEAVHE